VVNRRDDIVPRNRFVELPRPLRLRVGSYSVEILNWGYLGQCWWRNYLHTHTFFEICYAFGGRGTFEILGTVHDIRAGHVFVAKPSEAHEIICSREKPLLICFWSYTLVPDRQRRPEHAEVDALLDAFVQSKKWVSDSATGMARTLDLLTDEVVHRHAGFASSVEALATKLLLDTARAVTDVPTTDAQTTPARTHTDAAVQTAERYLRDNYSRPIGVRDVAAQVHLSERHISRLFAKATGMSIMDYLTKVRIDTAAQLLLSQQLPIKQAAAHVGYPDVRYFTTLFRRRTGMTPGLFRQSSGTTFHKKLRHVGG